MKKLKYIHTLFLLIVIHVGAYCSSLDSLKHEAQVFAQQFNGKIADTILVNITKKMGNFYQETNSDSAISFYDKSINLIEIIRLNNISQLTINQEVLLEYYLSDVYYQKGLSNYFNSEYQEAKNQYLKCIAIYEKFKNNTDVPDQTKKKLLQVKALATSQLGNCAWVLNNYPEAFELYSEALELNRQLGLKEKEAALLGNMGVVMDELGRYAEALTYYFESLKLEELMGNKRGQAITLGNIGIIYYDQKEYNKALDYYQKSYELKKEINEVGSISITLGNMGVVYHDQNNLEKALEYYRKALAADKQHNNQQGVARHLGNIGMVYEELKVYDKALNYYQQALEIDQNLNNREGIGYQKSYIGSLNLATKNFTTAEKYLLDAYQIAKDIGTLDLMKYTTGKLSELYEATNNKEKAFDFYKLHITYKDSLANEENTRASIEKEMQYLYEKKAIADSIAYEKEKALNQAKIAQQQAELKAKRNQQYGLFAFSVLIIVFSIFMYNRYRVSQKQKEIIANQKQIVEQKNTEIVDSIRYAKRIQNAILPAVETINNQLPESFVLYMPKDIVSGDFYWMESLPLTPSEGGETPSPLGRDGEGLVFFATADCTGHGVPGALVSVVCANALSKALLETSPPHPALLLNKTREIVINHFDKSGEDVKDGMDIALCSLRFNVSGSRLNSPQTSNMEHKTTAVLQYAGANNPLYIVRNGELMETKPDKQPIGKHFRNEPYTHHEINLQSGDTLYIFTDGYADQFGGPKGKKFMYKQFKELLLSIYDKSMDEQKQLLYQAFNAWKGDLEQVDDVCVIGVRI